MNFRWYVHLPSDRRQSPFGVPIPYHIRCIIHREKHVSNNFLHIDIPIERIIELYEQNVALYERMLQAEKEKVALLEILLRDKCSQV